MVIDVGASVEEQLDHFHIDGTFTEAEVPHQRSVSILACTEDRGPDPLKSDLSTTVVLMSDDDAPPTSPNKKLPTSLKI
jgi:hypothetical protein